MVPLSGRWKLRPREVKDTATARTQPELQTMLSQLYEMPLGPQTPSETPSETPRKPYTVRFLNMRTGFCAKCGESVQEVTHSSGPLIRISANCPNTSTATLASLDQHSAQGPGKDARPRLRPQP